MYYTQVSSLMMRFVSHMITLTFSPIASALSTLILRYIHHSHTTGALLAVRMTVFWDKSFCPLTYLVLAAILLKFQVFWGVVLFCQTSSF